MKPRANKRNELQRQSILDATSRLFIDKGFGGTNFNDIADALGVTRTALYYYFPSKESLLEALTEEVTEKASRLAHAVSHRDELPPEEALRQLILQHAELILSHPLQFRVVERSESSLPEPRRSAAQDARRAVLDNFVSVIQRGMDAGSFRAVDARIAAFSIIGMCNWCAWWFVEAGPTPADAVAQTIADLGLRALAPEPARRAGRTGAPPDPLAQMREALDQLEAQKKRGSR